MRKPFNGQMRITSAQGKRTYYNTSVGATVTDTHKGLDIVGDDEKYVRATHSGTVAISTRMFSTATAQWGNYIRVDSDKKRYYCHLKQRLVNVGDKVKEGDVLGVMGGTGIKDNSYAEHLHYEVRDLANNNMPAYDDIGVTNACQTLKVEQSNLVEINTNILNVRSAPSTDYNKINTLTSGQTVEIAEKTNDNKWGFVKDVGWICLDYTKAV